MFSRSGGVVDMKEKHAEEVRCSHNSPFLPTDFFLCSVVMKRLKRASPSARPSFFRSGHSFRLHKPCSSRMKTAAATVLLRFRKGGIKQDSANKKPNQPGLSTSKLTILEPDCVHTTSRLWHSVGGGNQTSSSGSR
jgi:hypothetical protein